MERLTLKVGLCSMASTEFCFAQKDCYTCSHGRACFDCLAAYEDAMSLERAQELAQAEKDGRLVVLPDAKYTDSDGEEALRKAMWICGNTNNPVTRYAADAIAEKLCREAEEAEAALAKRKERQE